MPPAAKVAPSSPAAGNGGSQPSGGGTPPSNDPLATVDQILAKLELGNIALNLAHAINLHDKAIIQLLLGFEKSVSELKEMIEAAGGKVGASIRGLDRMVSRLSSPNFAITAVTPDLQAVSRIDITE